VRGGRVVAAPGLKGIGVERAGSQVLAQAAKKGRECEDDRLKRRRTRRRNLSLGATASGTTARRGDSIRRKISRLMREHGQRGDMKTLRRLAILGIAVTGLTVGGWAQGYPPNGGTSSSEEAAPGGDEQRPALEQNYPQGPNGEAAPSLGGQEQKSQSQNQGPAPAVARVSLIHGDVSTARGDTGEWASTTVNAPLVQGDQVATGEKARAEIQLDYASVLRLAAHSQAKIAELSRTHVQVQVAQGYTSFTSSQGGEAEVEIDTPNVAVHPLRAGRYRVQVNSDAETDVIVREGEAEVTTPQGSTRVHAGELITIRGTDQPEYKVSSAPENDDWDQWNRDRDHVIRESQSVSHTNRYYTGVNDLDGHGRWIYVPGYGNVWQPYQESTWAPYQAGRWVYEPYYGWTWVSFEPWGWTPYHYGRWLYYQDSWCWWPGPVYVHYRPLWSPAFVFFVGFGHRSGFGFGSIGWFPVGPHDPFYPWYGRGFNRVNVVNITNINVINRGRRGEFISPLAVRGRQPFFSNANLALTNPHIRGSITSVSAENFGRGGHEGWRHGVEEHELRDSRVMTANLPVVPSRESLHAGSGNAGSPAGIQMRSNDHFFTRHQPAAAPESFHDQAARVQRVVGPEAAGAHGRENVGVRTGNAEVPRLGGAASGGVNQKGGMSQKDSPGRISTSPNEGMSPNRSSGNGGSNAGGNSGQDSRGDHGGWNKFGSPAGRSGGEVGSGHSEQIPSTNRSSGGDRQSVDRQSVDRQANDRQSNDRQSVTNQASHPQENGGGWQKFPSNSGAGGGSQTNRNDRVDQGSAGGGKPPLELHRPVVTPRNEDHGSPSPTRTPDVHSDPRNTPSPSHSEPRYSPPSRSESRGGSGSPYHGGGGSSSRGSGGSSSHGSSGGSSSHSSGGHESKSSSGSKH
jgi:hypothetical protein